MQYINCLWPWINLWTKLGVASDGHTCSHSSVLRRGEEVALWHGDGSQTQDAHHYQVDEAGLRRAVEGVVQPGHEGAHDEEGDPAVVQPAHRQRFERKQLGGVGGRFANRAFWVEKFDIIDG